MHSTSLFLITTAAILGLHACGGDDTAAPVSPVFSPGTTVAGETSLSLNETVLSLNRDGSALMRFPLDGLQLGVVESLEEDRAYDPWFLVESADKLFYQSPDGLRWLDVESVSITEQTKFVLCPVVLSSPG